MSVKVLLVDDQSLIRAGFRMILGAEADIEVVGECSDGAQAVDSTKRLAPDVVLMDIRMPEMDGIEATRRIVGDRDGEAEPAAGPDPDHLRPRRVRLRRARRGRQRLPAQGRARRPAARRDPHGRRGRGACWRHRSPAG